MGAKTYLDELTTRMCNGDAQHDEIEEAAHLIKLQAVTLEAVLTERDALRALVSEAHDFWQHYACLNESAQDELNDERLAILQRMDAARSGGGIKSEGE